MISCYVRAGLRVPHSRALYSPVAHERFRPVGKKCSTNDFDNRAAETGFCAFPIMLV
ncbi:hypothetical protein L3H50_10050 [Corynebacterium sp. MC-04]|uniref:Uncharacterized protein n=1 Tax=Corynebacterium parakroppenstedtii TaxID=2828363 RepID=A0ABS9HLU6_9CORY|nr:MULTISPECIES: hypothetical protein [Corynebacterium]KXB49801.1 hypothetical protein HMPREF1861_01750 [Corynebacterium kroppenstedtii]MBY0789612.1 hypothetical protein [Corynebacterium parakroppenstedtii]MBY0793330.1 hypothetical protein [Corynebacterium parakroppenstedtii]MBY0795369.1 hypothetical protein [Corynebacterium parakroppenstedtii]MBY0797432.1 hypothetical protein [Corynebacterium parakroppenstedtii]